MAKTKGLSGLAIGMVGAGGLLIYSAIKGSSPLDELRSLLGGITPERLSTTSKAQPMEAFSGGSFGGASTGKVGKASSAGSAPHVAAEMAYISQTFGVDTGGFARSGHVANSDHYIGLAIDAMTGSRRDIGDAIVAYYQANASAKHVKYIIWQRELWNASSKTSHSCGAGCARCGGDCHERHVHISFYPLIRGRVGR